MIDTEHMARHANDVERLVRIAHVNGVSLSDEAAYTAWSEASDASAASWLRLDSNDGRNWSLLSSYMRGENTPRSDMQEFDKAIITLVRVADRSGIYMTAPIAYQAWRHVSQEDTFFDWKDLPANEETLLADLKRGIALAAKHV